MNSPYRKLLLHEIKTYINSGPASKAISEETIKTFKFFPPKHFSTYSDLLTKHEYTAYVDWLINTREKMMLPTDFSATTLIILSRYLSTIKENNNEEEQELFKKTKPHHFICALILTGKLMEYPFPSIKQFSDVLGMELSEFWAQNMRIELSIISVLCCRFGVPPISRAELIRRIGYTVWFVDKVELMRDLDPNFNSEMFWTLNEDATKVLERAFMFCDMSLYDTNLLACSPYDIAIACLTLACKVVEKDSEVKKLENELNTKANRLVTIRTRTVKAIEDIIITIFNEKKAIKAISNSSEP